MWALHSVRRAFRAVCGEHRLQLESLAQSDLGVNAVPASLNGGSHLTPGAWCKLHLSD